MSGLKRVVVTGEGVVSCLGNNVRTFWNNLEKGKSGIRRITRFDPSEHRSQIAGEVDFDPKEELGDIQGLRTDRMARASQYALSAAKQAIESSGFPYKELPDNLRTRVGVIIAANLIGMERIAEETTKKVRDILPTMVPMAMNNAPAYWIQKAFDLHGLVGAASNACASSGNALLHGFDSIRTGRLVAAVVGGTEDAIERTITASFGNTRAALCEDFNEDPEHGSRPFDLQRCGFVTSEGAGALVLEAYEFARARGANIIAEVLGIGATGDAGHLTAPNPDGKWSAAAMGLAMEDARISPEETTFRRSRTASAWARVAAGSSSSGIGIGMTPQ